MFATSLPLSIFLSTFINRTFLHKTTGVWLSGTDSPSEESLATVTCHHTIVFTSRTIATHHTHSLSQVHCPVITDNKNQHLLPPKRLINQTIINSGQRSLKQMNRKISEFYTLKQWIVKYLSFIKWSIKHELPM